jgi:cell division initiation protein
MRLNHLDILEQCFRNKFRGYNKEDVDTFLHLIADDFKEMAEEIELLNKKLAQRDRSIAKLREETSKKPSATKTENLTITPDMIKEKAKRIINVAREHADRHKKKAEQELSTLKDEINQIKLKKKNLIENIKSSAQEHLAQQKSGK